MKTLINLIQNIKPKFTEMAIPRFVVDESIELRLFEEHHAEELFALLDQNRSHLRQWLPWLDDNQHVNDTEEFIRATIEQFKNNNGFQTGIWYEGELAGVIGYHKIDWANRATSIGYWLSAEFEGKGIMTKSCEALVDYAFNQLKLNRVEIRCAVENKKSRAIPQRLKFKEEGTVRQSEWLYDHFVDHVIYGMLRDEWLKEKQNNP